MCDGNTKYQTINGTSYHAETDMLVIGVLERVRQLGQKVRIWYGDIVTGVAWAEEHDVYGSIGRSTGTIKIPLLRARRDSIGGGGILDHCIVAIKINDGGSRKIFAYKHQTFNPGRWTALSDDFVDGKFIKAKALHNSQVHATFKTFEHAVNYCDFMTGKRFCK